MEIAKNCQFLCLLAQGSRLPSAIPETSFSPTILKMNYGLETTHPEYLMEDPLYSQLQDFQTWCQQPLRLDRPLAYIACSSVTHEKSRQCLLLFFGFMKNMKKVGLS